MATSFGLAGAGTASAAAPGLEEIKRWRDLDAGK